jgi:para-aminobenzoate synthetase component 1
MRIPGETLYLYVLKQLTYKSSKEPLKPNIGELNKHFNHICILDSNPEANSNQAIQNDTLIAIGKTKELVVYTGCTLGPLQSFIDKNTGQWIFGAMSYDLKNEVENLHSKNTDNIGFPLLHFFVPEIVLQIKKETITVCFDDTLISEKRAADIYELTFKAAEISEHNEQQKQRCNIASRISRNEYISAVTQLKQHIQKGDIYEINFCQEFYAENALINTADTFKRLNAISQAPFSAYYNTPDHCLICSSPERFIQKQGKRLMSQPIKGTAKRSENKEEDASFKEQLKNSTKERSENVMIVDLVRNDLSKVAKRGSVNTDELFGIYSFKQVHQMISTVSCQIKDAIAFTDIIKSTFPMGSMTGAPKVSAMQLIEKYESTRRGLYSGSIGYINPEGDFDFNVVIRSIIYNRNTRYLSFMVGSAITDKSEAESEYDECLLKAKAMFDVLK